MANIKFTEYYQIPTWAICALVYGDESGLTKEDIEDIENFLESEHLEDYSLEVPDNIDEEKYFSSFPAFGLAADVVDCRFFK